MVQEKYLILLFLSFEYIPFLCLDKLYTTKVNTIYNNISITNVSPYIFELQVLYV